MSPKIIYFLFFLSGAAGLIYEIVWSRLFVLIFGSTTNSIVAVISAFLGGLAVGSLIFGKIADSLSAKKLLKTYAILELGTALAVVSTLVLIPLVKTIYAQFSDGSTVTFSLLATKFILSILVLLFPTILMGATLPILVNFVKAQKKSIEESVSLLYAVNTFGAVSGVLISAFILIELFGLKNTLLIAAAINILIAILAKFVKTNGQKIKSANPKQNLSISILFSKTNIFIILAFSISGLVSIAYEVLWTRILTPTVGTFIYAFAEVLALYLFGIASGSLIYKKFIKILPDKKIVFCLSELAIGFFALGSVYLTSNQIVLNKSLMILLVIFPATVFMGMTFPGAVSLISKERHTGKIVGLSYFSNTAGSIIGGLLASFLFLPHIGSSQSILFLSIINFILAAFLTLIPKTSTAIKFTTVALSLILLIFTSWLFIFKRYSLYENTTQWRINWAKANGINYIFKEDEVASVFGYQNPQNNDQNLFIDGVPTTGRVGETKLMAHIPVLLHPNPQKVLVIAFGMGTTFRSALTWDLEVDVVELVPSIPDFLHLFHENAQEVLANPRGKIIINDGRNYIFLTAKKYDIVTIDPPPPFNAAGTTVLYSKNFYEDITKKLNPGGIVSQWIWFGSREDDIAMAIKSFTDVFPFVLAFQNPQGAGGIFLEGSFSPLIFNKNSQNTKIAQDKPSKDFREFYKDFNLSQIQSLQIGDKDDLLKFVSRFPPITDNFPRTEYFILRQYFTKSPDLTKEENGRNFIGKIKNP